MARIPPLTAEEMAARGIDLSFIGSDFHELPNSVPTLAWRPDILQASGALWAAIMLTGTVDAGLKWMAGYMASMAAGCRYCSAHTGTATAGNGVSAEKLAAIWDFERSPLFSDAERAVLRVAVGAGQVPNAVSDADFADLARHFSREQQVEIVSVIALYGFFNRWNDTVGTTLEETPRHFAQTHLSPHGWDIGKHG
ncbi:carboxymuconolactone decarboxylase family protein [Niveispirillum sp.]|uniref:carboxymuconolactone decarboxylase family protein n=1 Tax=Niveispirillum sp. TaxID=1917217 RepID=UPI001B62B9ED|nr:carboxymuconolactone decarboxylase family protein [Niveispirillum sp.]MBP7337410.1 carboxymuconolactone decarboxylase family protein [Niveispirillum sp.]